MSLLVAAALLPLVLVHLHALWLMVSRRDGIAIACSLAAWLGLALLFKASRPSMPLAAVWLPGLYPYALLGISAVFWSLSRAQGNTAREKWNWLLSPARPDGPHALFLSVLIGHAGFAVLALWARPALLAYLYAPSATALCFLCYFLILGAYQSRRHGRRLGGFFVSLSILVLPPAAIVFFSALSSWWQGR